MLALNPKNDESLKPGQSSRGRVLLLTPPSQQLVLRDNYCGFSAKASYLWPPIDLLVQSGWLADDFEVCVLDAMAERRSTGQSLQRIGRIRPDAVFMLSSGATFEDDAAFARQIRQALPGARIVTGCSPMVIGGRQYLSRYPWVDGFLGNYASPDLREALLGRPHSTDLVTVGDEERAGAQAKSSRLSYPVPRHHLFPLRRYALPIGWSGVFSTVLTSIGCAHQCSFCAGSSIRYRKRPMEEVLQELDLLRSLDIQNLFFIDYTFTTSKRYVQRLCAAMQQRGFDFRWTCFARVDHLNDGVLTAMKQAGLDLLQIGVESGDDRILSRYKKGFTVAQAREAFALAKRHGIRTLAFFIIGLPGEDRETVQRTMDLALSLDPDLASFAMPTPDAGTILQEEALRSGLLEASPGHVVSTVFPIIGSDALKDGEIRRLRAHAIRKFYLRPSYLLKQMRSVQSLADLRQKASNALALLSR